MATKGTKKKSTVSPEKRILQAAMSLAAVQGWRDTTMADIADQTEMSLAELWKHFPSKNTILVGIVQVADDAVLRGSDASIEEEPVHDRLFDVIMRRLDALSPYKKGIAAVVNDFRHDPSSLACLAVGPMQQSLRWMLEAARIQPWGIAAPLQQKGLGLVYLAVFRVWLNDDDKDQAKTMAALDKALNRVESILSALRIAPLNSHQTEQQAAADEE